MKQILGGLLAVVLLVSVVGCSSNGGPYFQRSADRSVHSQKNRIYNPADVRHERHATGIESQTNDY